jgi:hypothetical protein
VQIPSTLQAGDTLTWTDSLSDYSAADGWTLKYRLAGPSIIDITGAADGADHSLDVSKTTSANYTPGRYKWTAYVEKGADSFTVATGTVEVLADLRQVTGSYEGRSHARRVYEALQATIEGRASKEQEQITINGRAVGYLKPTELRVEMLKWKQLAEQEEDEEKRKQGLSVSTGRILVQFR